MSPALAGRFFTTEPREATRHGFLLGEYANISCWQKCLIVMVPILINKDVFEPGYNDLKFKVRNHNYFFINLM